jgi:hypothetical protein
MRRRGQSSSPVTAAAYDRRHGAPSPVAVAEDGAEAEHQHGPSEVSASVCAVEMESLVALVGALKIASPCACAAVNQSACSLLGEC